MYILFELRRPAIMAYELRFVSELGDYVDHLVELRET